jgi:AbrB family looped-hinge helix DNA binding protein
MAAVKIGASRQIVIPKKACQELALGAGDYLDVVVKDGSLVMTPKTLVDKRLVERSLDSRSPGDVS